MPKNTHTNTKGRRHHTLAHIHILIQMCPAMSFLNISLQIPVLSPIHVQTHNLHYSPPLPTTPVFIFSHFLSFSH